MLSATNKMSCAQKSVKRHSLLNSNRNKAEKIKARMPNWVKVGSLDSRFLDKYFVNDDSTNGYLTASDVLKNRGLRNPSLTHVGLYGPKAIIPKQARTAYTDILSLAPESLGGTESERCESRQSSRRFFSFSGC